MPLSRSGCPAVTEGLDRFRESQILLRRVRGRMPTLPLAYRPSATAALPSGAVAPRGAVYLGGVTAGYGGRRGARSMLASKIQPVCWRQKFSRDRRAGPKARQLDDVFGAAPQEFKSVGRGVVCIGHRLGTSRDSEGLPCVRSVTSQSSHSMMPISARTGGKQSLLPMQSWAIKTREISSGS
jgi:hypothetical protein